MKNIVIVILVVVVLLFTAQYWIQAVVPEKEMGDLSTIEQFVADQVVRRQASPVKVFYIAKGEVNILPSIGGVPDFQVIAPQLGMMADAAGVKDGVAGIFSIQDKIVFVVRGSGRQDHEFILFDPERDLPTPQ